MKIDFSQVTNARTKLEEAQRLWRNAELARADVQLNKVQDGVKGIGTVDAWRKYRMALRDWPASDTFPDVTPEAPDAGV